MNMLMPGLKQDEGGQFYFAVIGNAETHKLLMPPPVRLRCAGRFYPGPDTTGGPYHLERCDPATGEWHTLRTPKKGGEDA